MSILFLTGGLLATVQDLGRTGFRRFGVNPNGVMDPAAARLVNILLGNDETEGVLEMHFPAPKILFEEDAFFALGGADFGALLGERRAENWRPLFAPAGGLLTFPEKLSGHRIYLSVRGGFRIEKWLGSASTNLRAAVGGYGGRPLEKGDRLFFARAAENRGLRAAGGGRRANYKISRGMVPPYSRFPTLRVTPGAEFGQLTAESRRLIETENFTVGRDSDRMGFRLGGAPLNLKKRLELISSPVDFGTVQLLPGGQLVILMADHQTAGGYPRAAHVVSRDLPLAGQLGAGDRVSFAVVSVEEAENLAAAFEKDLNLLKTAVKFQTIS